MWHATDTSVREEMAAGRIPADSDEVKALAPHGAPPPPKKFDNRLLPGDVFITMSSAGAGYGDPVLRDPELVLRDELDGRLLDGEALTVYGVVVDGDSVDVEETAQVRKTMFADRLAASTAPRAPRSGTLGESDNDLCSSCGLSLDTEVVAPGDPIVDDVVLATAP